MKAPKSSGGWTITINKLHEKSVCSEVNALILKTHLLQVMKKEVVNSHDILGSKIKYRSEIKENVYI